MAHAGVGADMSTKKCTKCGEEKELGEFYKRTGCVDGVVGACKSCVKLRTSEYHKLHPEIARKASLKHRKEHPFTEDQRLHVKEYQKKYREEHAEERKREKAERYRNNCDDVKEKSAKYRKERPETRRAYYAKNKEILNKYNSAYTKERYHKDIEYKLRCNLHSRLGTAVRRQASNKNRKTLELIGCNITELRGYLASKFSAGMTWEKFMLGEIHVDHIIPCVAFDLTDPEQQKKCFHFTNLQPLWATDNLKKGAKIVNLAVPVPNGPSSAREVDGSCCAQDLNAL